MARYVCICILIGLFTVFLNSLAEENSDVPLSNEELVARGEVQSCRGCSLNRLPDVKSFIYSDLPKYRGVEFHPIHGAVPHLVLFDESDKELDRINLSSLSRDECNELVRKWFSLKEEETETTASGKVHGEL
ncbi:selenoprotein M-like isoform X2 [Homalodisca vitripennis]|uniref:selenoprotein M-like isoform X2 n=1 Tax=Homalodisca vitripennis TaxID=197043 RepID=UPI001EEA85E7|nr:selenoprotein M-like isoform X2 [Homalodisca vitripennis]